MKNFLMAIFAATVLMTGCGENSQATSAEIKEATSVKQFVTIQVNGKIFPRRSTTIRLPAPLSNDCRLKPYDR